MLLEYNSSCKISYFIGGELLIDDKRLYCPPFLPTPHFKKKKRAISLIPIHIPHPQPHSYLPPNPYLPTPSSIYPLPRPHSYLPTHSYHLCYPHPPAPIHIPYPYPFMSATSSILHNIHVISGRGGPSPRPQKIRPPPPISPNLPLGWNHHSPLKAIPNKQ